MLRRLIAGILAAALLIAVAAPAFAASPHAYVDYPLYSTAGAPFYWARDDLYAALGLDLLQGYPGGTRTVDLARPFREEPTAPKVDYYLNMAPVIREVPAWGEVRPGATITRAEFATILARATGIEDEYVPGTAAPFRDTPATAWYQPYLTPLFNRNVVRLSDYFLDTLRPDEPITRAEIAAWVARALDSLGYITPGAQLTFSDIPPRYQYERELRKAVAWGIIQGYPDGTFRPNATANRAEAAVMIMRMLRRLSQPNPDVAELHRVIQAAHDVHTLYMRDRPDQQIPDPHEFAKYMRPYWTDSAIQLRVNPAPSEENCYGTFSATDVRWSSLRGYQSADGLLCVSKSAGLGDYLAASLTENYMRNRLEAVHTYTTITVDSVDPQVITDRFAVVNVSGELQTSTGSGSMNFARYRYSAPYYLRLEDGVWRVSGQGHRTTQVVPGWNPTPLRARLENMTLDDFLR